MRHALVSSLYAALEERLLLSHKLSSNSLDFSTVHANCAEKAKDSVKTMLTGGVAAGATKLLACIGLVRRQTPWSSEPFFFCTRICTAAATGAVWGACLAALRNESIKFYSASMGTNFFLLGSTYIGVACVASRRRVFTAARSDSCLCVSVWDVWEQRWKR